MFSCFLSHALFSVSLGNQTGVQSTFTTFYEVDCDVIDGGRASQLSTHLPTCAEGAPIGSGSSDSSMVSNLLSNIMSPIVIIDSKDRGWGIQGSELVSTQALFT